jgi:uncharacterized Fe-S radical SAM superfamily protein PflX
MRESAVLGFLEPHTIAGVQRGQNGWVYTVIARPNQPIAAPHFGERRSMVNGATMYFQECEFVTICEALELAEAYHLRQLAVIQSRLRTYCVSAGTTGTTGP